MAIFLKDPNSAGVHADITTQFGTKALTQNLNSLPMGKQLFFVSWAASGAH